MVTSESESESDWSSVVRSREVQRESIKQDQTLKKGAAANQNFHVSDIAKGC